MKLTFETNLSKWKDEFFTRLDPFLKRVQDVEDENIILKARDEGRDEARNQFEDRVKRLEVIHPQGRHA